MKIIILFLIFVVFLNSVELSSQGDYPPGFAPHEKSHVHQESEPSSSQPVSKSSSQGDHPPGFIPNLTWRDRLRNEASSSQPVLELSSAQPRYPTGGTAAIVDDFKIGSIDNSGTRHQIWLENTTPPVSVRVHISGHPVLKLDKDEFNQMMDDFIKTRFDPQVKVPEGKRVVNNEGYMIGIVDKYGRAKRIKRGDGKDYVKVHVSGLCEKWNKTRREWIEEMMNSPPVIESVETPSEKPNVNRSTSSRPRGRGRGRSN